MMNFLMEKKYGDIQEAIAAINIWKKMWLYILELCKELRKVSVHERVKVIKEIMDIPAGEAAKGFLMLAVKIEYGTNFVLKLSEEV